MSKGNSISINIGGGSLLLCLILLKAFNIANWSWFWILSPLWLPIAALLAFISIVLFICVIVSILVAL